MEFDNLITLIKTISDSAVTKFQYEQDGVKLCIKKDAKVKIAAASGVGAECYGTDHGASPQGEPEVSGSLIKSPLVGRFYAAPAEDAQAFVAVGDRVKKGQVVAIVEAMKLMNDIESDFDGVVAEILVENGETVEYGQPLIRIV